MPDQDKVEVFKVHDAAPGEFDEPKREKPTFYEELPGSSNKEFWGKDAHIVHARKEDIEKQRQDLFEQTGKNHKPMIVGGEFICVSCPYQHSLPISTKEFTMNMSGQIVAIDVAN